MADESYFFTRNYAYDTDVIASTTGTSVGANTPDKAIDYSQTTYWETTDALPVLKIDLSVAQAIDSIWFMSSNVANYRLFYSTDDIVYNAAHADQTANVNGYNYDFEFTPQTARYWRLDITTEVVGGTNTLIYEVFLMTHLATLEVATDSLPANIIVTPVDRSGGIYQLADGSVTAFRSEKIRHDIVYEFEHTPKANRDALYDIYHSTTYGIRPNIVTYPDPDEYPANIFRVIFENIEFPFRYTSNYKGSGFSGTLRFKEH